MIPASFDYHAPNSLQDAFALLKEYGDDAKILSGGHSLLPMMKLRLATPEHVVDINNIPDLSYIKEESGTIKIGGLTREAEIEHSDMLTSHYPIFSDVTKLIADPQVRNRGTIGGNLAHGDAANDHPAVMLALNAEIVATSEKGERTIAIDDFFHGFYSTDLESEEILTEIRLPVPLAGTGTAYHKLERKVGDYATVGVAVSVHMDGNVCRSAGIGLTNVSAIPLRASRSEQILTGKELSDELLNSAAQFAAEDCSPSADLRGDEEYKRAMVKVLVKRMIQLAVSRSNA